MFHWNIKLNFKKLLGLAMYVELLMMIISYSKECRFPPIWIMTVEHNVYCKINHGINKIIFINDVANKIVFNARLPQYYILTKNFSFIYYILMCMTRNFLWYYINYTGYNYSVQLTFKNNWISKHCYKNTINLNLYKWL